MIVYHGKHVRIFDTYVNHVAGLKIWLVEDCLIPRDSLYHHYVRLETMDVGVCYSKRLHCNVD